jgi:DNA topoisomerase-1
MTTTLIVCEKPDAAKRIAEALSDGKLNSQTKYRMPYYDIIYSNERLIICPALGHLYSIDARTKSKTNSH